jgi:hypothetical protein
MLLELIISQTAVPRHSRCSHLLLPLCDVPRWHHARCRRLSLAAQYHLQPSPLTLRSRTSRHRCSSHTPNLAAWSNLRPAIVDHSRTMQVAAARGHAKPVVGWLQPPAHAQPRLLRAQLHSASPSGLWPTSATPTGCSLATARPQLPTSRPQPTYSPPAA